MSIPSSGPSQSLREHSCSGKSHPEALTGLELLYQTTYMKGFLDPLSPGLYAYDHLLRFLSLLKINWRCRLAEIYCNQYPAVECSNGPAKQEPEHSYGSRRPGLEVLVVVVFLSHPEE